MIRNLSKDRRQPIKISKELSGLLILVQLSNLLQSGSWNPGKTEASRVFPDGPSQFSSQGYY